MDSSQGGYFFRKPFNTTSGQWILIIVFIAVVAVSIHYERAILYKKQPVMPLRVISADESYATDGTYVYNQDQPIFGADAATFKLLDPNSYYAVDKNHVYYKTDQIPLAQLASFVLLDQAYAKDSEQVYYEGTLIPYADASTFILLDQYDYYAKDSRQAYYEGVPIDGADAASFVELGTQSYAKDNNAVYYSGIPIDGADPSSFKLIPNNNNYDARDNLHMYDFGSVAN